MSNEGMTLEKRSEPHFFDKDWSTRIVALALGVSLIVALIVPGLPGREEAEDEAQTPDIEQTRTNDDRPAVSNIAAGESTAGIGATDEGAEVSDAFLNAYTQCAQALTDGDYEAALSFAEACLFLSETDEETVIALAQKGSVLFQLERYAQSEEAYQQLLAMNKKELVSMLSLYSRITQCQLLEGKLEEALQSCNLAFELAENDKDRADLYAIRGVIYFYGEDYEAAKEDFEAALQLGYEDTELLRTQIDQCEQLLLTGSTGAAAGNAPPQPTETETNAAVHYFSGDYRQAAVEFRRLLGNSYYYTDMQLYSNIAKCEYLLGEYASAVESCTAGLSLRGNEERAALYTLRGSAYMALGESALAAADFMSAIERGAADPKLNALQAAICYYFSEDYERCIAVGTPLIDAEGYEEAAMWVALSQYMVMDFAAAAELLERSVELDQSYCRQDELYRLLTRCRFQLGQYADAIESASRGLTASAGSAPMDESIAAELHALRASAFLSVGQYEAALEDLSIALETDEANAYDLLTQMTLCAFLLGNYEDTLIYGKRALEKGEPTSDLCYWIGLAGISTEQYEEARDALQACRDLDPMKENIWFYIGVCSFSMEDYETAIEQFTASVDANEPAADRSRYNRALCYLQQGDYKNAKTDLEAAAASEAADVAEDAANLLESLRTVIG